MLVKKIRELQYLCAFLMLAQLFFYKWALLFNFINVLLSLIIIGNAKIFRCISIKYNYWVIYLFFYRIAVMNWYNDFQICVLIYYFFSLYIACLLLIMNYHRDGC